MPPPNAPNPARSRSFGGVGGPGGSQANQQDGAGHMFESPVKRQRLLGPSASAASAATSPVMPAKLAGLRPTSQYPRAVSSSHGHGGMGVGRSSTQSAPSGGRQGQGGPTGTGWSSVEDDALRLGITLYGQRYEIILNNPHFRTVFRGLGVDDLAHRWSTIRNQTAPRRPPGPSWYGMAKASNSTFGYSSRTGATSLWGKGAYGNSWPIRTGHWIEDEHERFNVGLRRCGIGRWDEIAKLYVRTRKSIDVQAYAHRLMGLPAPEQEQQQQEQQQEQHQQETQTANRTKSPQNSSDGATGEGQQETQTANWTKSPRNSSDGATGEAAGMRVEVVGGASAKRGDEWGLFDAEHGKSEEALHQPIARVVSYGGRRYLDPVLATHRLVEGVTEGWLQPGEVVWIVRPDLPPWPAVVANPQSPMQHADLGRYRKIGHRVILALFSTFEQPIVSPEILVPFPGPLRRATATVSTFSKDMPPQSIAAAVSVQLARGSAEEDVTSAWALSRVIQSNYRRAISQLFRFLTLKEELGVGGGGLGALDDEVAAHVRRGGSAYATDSVQLGEPGALSFRFCTSPFAPVCSEL